MKRIFEILVLITITCSAYAIDPTIYKGNFIDGFAVKVTSTSTLTPWNEIATSTAPILSPIYISSQHNNSGYILLNGAGGRDVWLDNSATITTTGGAAESFKLSAGSSIQIDGKQLDNIYGRTLAADSQWTTMYIFLTGQQ